MGRAFEPLTVGYDWEMAVLAKTAENVSARDVETLSDDLRRRLPRCQPGTDLELVESRVGPARSLRELLAESRAFEMALREALERKGWSLLRSGTRPFEREPVGAHIHVGTVTEWRAGVGVANGMARYVPPLAALMANSPVYRRRAGEYKSYRVASFAEWCSMPQSILPPGLSQPGWGGDVCVKVGWGSTIELRVGDGVSSTRLMCEVASLVAGLMQHVGSNEADRPLTEREYGEILRNRWRAAKQGLQAILTWDGAELPVQTVLTAMLDLAQDGMAELGASVDDLEIVRAMIAKRQTQADFQLAVYATERGDAHRFTRTMANIQRDPEAFETYLKRAPVLPVGKPISFAEHVLSRIEIETPYNVLFRQTPLSPVQLDGLLAEFTRDGLVLEERSETGIRLFTRADLARGGTQNG
jgi:gamma-glutamyl:cysteine ligase YbdK (ATP-grasp superfamily)